eukprot:8684311-Karenia_brevis.AAC.1
MRTHGSLYPPQGASANWCSSVGDNAIFSPKQNLLNIPVNQPTLDSWAANRDAGTAVFNNWRSSRALEAAVGKAATTQGHQVSKGHSCGNQLFQKSRYSKAATVSELVGRKEDVMATKSTW